MLQIVDQVEREHGRVVITEHGRPAAVVVSVHDLESREETPDVMGKPRLLEQIRDRLAEAGTGQAGPPGKDEASRCCAAEALRGHRVDAHRRAGVGPASGEGRGRGGRVRLRDAGREPTPSGQARSASSAKVCTAPGAETSGSATASVSRWRSSRSSTAWMSIARSDSRQG
ncbi:hypothetical protein GCM10012283_26240 [Phycicoccus endophyticus]|nr:hypothetical protein GCM10012283_26240 [Phycicoccus endophyticus]